MDGFKELHQTDKTATAIIAAITLLIALAVALAFSAQPAQAMSYKKQGATMTKALKAYKAGKYSKAYKYAKKLPKYVKDPTVKKMGAAHKAAFLKVTENLGSLDSFFLADVDNNGKADLVVRKFAGSGARYSSYKISVYKYKSGKAKRVAKTKSIAYGSISLCPKRKGLVINQSAVSGMGYATLGLGQGKLSGSKLKIRSIGKSAWNDIRLRTSSKNFKAANKISTRLMLKECSTRDLA